MKSELLKFDKKKVEYIKKKYSITPNNESKVAEHLSNSDILRKQLEKHKKLLAYMKALDDNRIKEEDIPDEYIGDLKKLYVEKILKLKKKKN